ncbi:Hypothetical predicted protein [Podarcis lilfordi]|uniref:Uncharacterized protein n=1 Tax=Podarcis lilfordi TaxID=74358 RepID=A0AA35JVA2_9SAUR|nr:Hypothetical predicted protein [Podarcis lilfordi]
MHLFVSTDKAAAKSTELGQVPLCDELGSRAPPLSDISSPPPSLCAAHLPK